MEARRTRSCRSLNRQTNGAIAMPDFTVSTAAVADTLEGWGCPDGTSVTAECSASKLIQQRAKLTSGSRPRLSGDRREGGAGKPPPSPSVTEKAEAFA